MSDIIHLEPNMVPAQLRGAYAGRKFKAMVCETVTIPRTAGLWDGGSRETYTAIEFETGREVTLSSTAAPDDRSRRDNTVTLRPGFCVVLHSVFMGADSGLTFYIHPANAATLLPAPAAGLSEHESIVLTATRSYKSSYGGKDRYQMARDDVQFNAAKLAAFPSRDQWDAAKAALIAKGLLNKAGAITTAGRNASR